MENKPWKDKQTNFNVLLFSSVKGYFTEDYTISTLKLYK